MVGRYTAIEPNINPYNLRLEIDNHLIKCNLTPLGTEPNDTELIQELLDEVMISVLGQGINRKTRRDSKQVKLKTNTID